MLDRTHIKQLEVSRGYMYVFKKSFNSISQYTLEKLNGFKFPVTDGTKHGTVSSHFTKMKISTGIWNKSWNIYLCHRHGQLSWTLSKRLGLYTIQHNFIFNIFNGTKSSFLWKSAIFQLSHIISWRYYLGSFFFRHFRWGQTWAEYNATNSWFLWHVFHTKSAPWSSPLRTGQAVQLWRPSPRYQ